MRSRRMIIVHVLASVAIGFVATAAGILTSFAMDPTDTLHRAVPVLVSVLVAIGGGYCSSRLVPWLVDGGLREMLYASSGEEPRGTTADDRRAAHRQES